MRRGEVYWAEFAPRSGREQRGPRPAVVVSHDAFNAHPGWGSVIVVPVSSSTRAARRGPTAIAIPEGTCGLTSPSFALCHQVTTLDRAKLTRRLGRLPDEVADALDAGLLAALDLAPRTRRSP